MNVIQLFYTGADNHLWTRWRIPDGTWPEEHSLWGNPKDRVAAAAIPGTDTLQVFFRGTDNRLYSRWQNPDATWSGEQRLRGVLNGNPIAVQVPGTGILQLFYRGTDNAIYTHWRKADGSWSAEQRVGGVLNGDPVAAQVPGTDILQLFYRGTDNSIYSIWRNPGQFGTWSGEQHIGGVLNSDLIAAETVAPIPASYTVVLMLWGPPQPPGQTKWLSTLTGTDLSRALTTIAASTYFNRLTQYNVEQVSIWPSFPPQLSNPPWPPGNSQFTTLFNTSTDLPNVIATSFSSGIPSPDTFSNTIPVYIVITPRGGLATDASGDIGDHQTATWGPDNLIYIYCWVGAQGNLNDTLVVATHEIVEAIGANGGAPKELCDGCQSKYGTVSPGIDSYTVETYFDAQANQCVAPPGFAKPA